MKDTYEERVFYTVMQRDAWFQVLIGSKRRDFAKGLDDDPESVTNVALEVDNGRMTHEERARTMLDLRPR